jgi:hypothetical protein
MKIISWIIAILGLWEAGDIAAFFVPGFGKVPSFLLNHILVGLILVIAGAWAALARTAGAARMMHWIAAAAGAWLILASFLLRSPANAAGLWNDILVGGVVFIFSVWAALSNPRAAS